MENKRLSEVKALFPAQNHQGVWERLGQELRQLNHKIVVLDDDPTGVQTVHGIYVYTNWSKESLREAFEDSRNLFFLLTNSRGLTAGETEALHEEIAENIGSVAREKGKAFLLVSRGDSTLRGHYPLETQALRRTLERGMGQDIGGEVIMPFFPEGGRYTVGDVHYVADGEILTPAGETEFAKDKTFGYHASDLKDWVEEKTAGQYPARAVTSVSLEELRREDYEGIRQKLLGVKGFGKVIVNALSYDDVAVFVTALLQAIGAGARFLFRTAAAFTKVVGGVGDKPLLTHEELINPENKNGGIIIIGSHVQKTTLQLDYLRKRRDDGSIRFVEFNQHLVLDERAFEAETRRVIAQVEKDIVEGQSVAVYTRRERFDLNTDNKEDELRVAVKIADALTSIVGRLKVRPNYIIAKGGITSSDIGTKGLGVKKALVMGQILKGIPVWLTGPESKFPDMPYVIFPGNVGGEDALYQAVDILSLGNTGSNPH